MKTEAQIVGEWLLKKREVKSTDLPCVLDKFCIFSLPSSKVTQNRSSSNPFVKKRKELRQEQRDTHWAHTYKLHQTGRDLEVHFSKKANTASWLYTNPAALFYSCLLVEHSSAQSVSAALWWRWKTAFGLKWSSPCVVWSWRGCVDLISESLNGPRTINQPGSQRDFLDGHLPTTWVV